MSTYKIAVFVGSLRAASINLRLARALEKLVPPDFKFDYVNLDVPLFNQDNENNLPRAWPSSSSRSPNPRACCSSRPSTIARCPPPSRTPSTGARVRGVTTPGPARPPGCSAPRPAPPAPRSCSSTCATSWPPKAQHADHARGLPAVLGRPGERPVRDHQRRHAQVPAGLDRPLRRLDPQVQRLIAAMTGRGSFPRPASSRSGHAPAGAPVAVGLSPPTVGSEDSLGAAWKNPAAPSACRADQKLRNRSKTPCAALLSTVLPACGQLDAAFIPTLRNCPRLLWKSMRTA